MIELHPSTNIIDSSKLTDFLRCRRRYFYSYILGWKTDLPAQDAFFGSCWHLAREHQLINGYDDIEGAFQVFLQEYRSQFPPETDNLYKPKIPEAVPQALANFAVTYYRDLEENELLHGSNGEPYTEISGSVPIDDSRKLYFRMDSILKQKNSGKIFSWDHKSTTARNLMYPNWEMDFYLSIQNGTYTHCLYCLFPIEQVLGVEFCGCGFEYLVRGSSARPAGYYSTLKRVSAFKRPDQMNVWLWTVIDLMNELEREIDRLNHCTDSDDVMEAFPMNPGGCTKFKGCEFHAFCLAWDNPLRRCQEPPSGFFESFWDPTQMDTRNKMNLEWK